MKTGRKIFVQRNKDILTIGKARFRQGLNKIGAFRFQFARTKFINSQNIRWLEPLTLLVLLGLLLVLVWLMLP